jgi:hypothetical protein
MMVSENAIVENVQSANSQDLSDIKTSLVDIINHFQTIENDLSYLIEYINTEQEQDVLPDSDVEDNSVSFNDILPYLTSVDDNISNISNEILNTETVSDNSAEYISRLDESSTFLSVIMVGLGITGGILVALIFTIFIRGLDK